MNLKLTILSLVALLAVLVVIPFITYEADAKEMFAEIRAAQLLDKYRGMPKVKLSRLSKIIQAVGNIALLHPEIAEIDLNPIIIHGAEPVVADALMVLESKP